MEFYCGRTSSNKPSFPFRRDTSMFFFNTGLGYVPEIMTTGNVFKRRGVIISNNNDKGLPIFFIHESDIAKPEWII